MNHLSRLDIVIGAAHIFNTAVLFMYISFSLFCSTVGAKHKECKIFYSLTVQPYIFLTTCLLSLLTSIFLLFNLPKKRKLYALPWICSFILGMGFGIVRLEIETFLTHMENRQYKICWHVITFTTLLIVTYFVIFYPLFCLMYELKAAVQRWSQNRRISGDRTYMGTLPLPTPTYN